MTSVTAATSRLLQRVGLDISTADNCRKTIINNLYNKHSNF